MNHILIALGSNLQKEHNLPAAVRLIQAHSAINLVAVSPVYETLPIGSNGQPSQQPAFHNGALLIQTELTSADLRDALRTIEAQLGRVRSADKFAPRPIDLDIAMIQSNSPEGAQIIHADPDIGRFIHLSMPLADLAPTWIVPASGETLAQIAARHRAQSTQPPKQIG